MVIQPMVIITKEKIDTEVASMSTTQKIYLGRRTRDGLIIPDPGLCSDIPPMERACPSGQSEPTAHGTFGIAFEVDGGHPPILEIYGEECALGHIKRKDRLPRPRELLLQNNLRHPDAGGHGNL